MEGKKSASDVDPDPSLDFLSAKFDPLLALRVVSTDIKMPCPDVQACYSLDAYKSIMRARWSGSGIRDAIDQRASAAASARRGRPGRGRGGARGRGCAPRMGTIYTSTDRGWERVASKSSPHAHMHGLHASNDHATPCDYLRCDVPIIGQLYL